MKILVALDNKIIKEKLNEIYNDDVYVYDIDYMEGVIEFLSRTSDEYILITKDSLNGNINNKLYIKQIKLANPNTKIIYLVNKLDTEYKEFLFANEVLNILEGENISFEALRDCIDENRQIVYKFIDSHNKNSLNEAAVQYKTESQVLTKELIAIYGTSGSGKSVISGSIAKDLCKRLNISVALLDMDIQNPSIDILNNIEGQSNSLSQVVEDVDKSHDINKIMDKYMIKDRNNKNLWYMTNNISIFDCQNRLSNKYYEQIYQSMSIKYDYTLVDLPSSPFLDVVPYTLTKATKIIFVINPNYVSIRQAVKYLDLINKLWDIPRDRILLFINKIQRDSLDNSQIESMLQGYKIVGGSSYNRFMDSYINGSKESSDMDINIESLYENLGIKKCNIKSFEKSVAKILLKKWRQENGN